MTPDRKNGVPRSDTNRKVEDAKLSKIYDQLAKENIPSNPQAPCHSADIGCYQINTNTFGCPTKVAFNRVLQFMAQGDQVAAASGIASWCTVLNKGDAVYLDHYHFGSSQIHLQGSTESLWVMNETFSR